MSAPEFSDSDLAALGRYALRVARGERARDPENVAQETLKRFTEQTQRRELSGRPPIEHPFGWARTVVVNLVRNEWNRHGRDEFITSEEQYFANGYSYVDPAGMSAYRSVVGEIRDRALWVQRGGDRDCPMCLARGRHICERNPLVRDAAASVISRLVIADPPPPLVERSVRVVVEDTGLWDPGVTDVSTAAGTRWIRGPAMCVSFAIHAALVPIKPARAVTPTLVRDTAVEARKRIRARTWIPAMETTMTEWCDDHHVHWPPTT